MPAWLWTPAERARGPGHPAAAGDLRREPLHPAPRRRARRGGVRRARAGALLAARPRAASRSTSRAPDVVRPAMSRAMSLDWEQTVADGVGGPRRRSAARDERRPASACSASASAADSGFNVAAVTEPGLPGQLLRLRAAAGCSRLAPQVTAPSLHHFGLADDYIARRDRRADPRGRHGRGQRGGVRDLRGRQPRLRQRRLLLPPPRGVASSPGSAPLRFLGEHLPVRPRPLGFCPCLHRLSRRSRGPAHPRPAQARRGPPRAWSGAILQRFEDRGLQIVAAGAAHDRRATPPTSTTPSTSSVTSTRRCASS